MKTRGAHRKKLSPAERGVRALNGVGLVLGRLALTLSLVVLAAAAAPIAVDVARDRGYLDMATFLETASSFDAALAQTPLALGPAEEMPSYTSFDAPADDAMERTASAALSLVPTSVRVDFDEQCWSVVFTSTKNLSDYMPAGVTVGNVTGLTAFSENTIYVRASSHEIVESTGHEFGHYVDYRLAWPSQTARFEKIWRDEKDSYATVAGDYPAMNQKEFFASVYNDVLLKRDARRTLAPQAFSFVDEAMARWEAEHGDG